MNQVLPYYEGALEAADAPPDLSQYPDIEADFETDGVDIRTSNPIGIAVGFGDKQVYVAWGHRGGGNSTDPETAARWLKSLRGKRISNHTTKFEIHMSRRMDADLREGGTTFHDVSHSAALLDDHRKIFALDALAKDELGEGKIELFSKSNLADLPAGAVAAYAKRDVVLVSRLRAAYAPRLHAESLQRVSALEDALIPAVVEMEANGMPLDMPLLEAWNVESKKLTEKLQWDLYKATGSQINPDAPTDMSRLFLQCGESITRTETGAPSFTAPIVQAAAARHESIRLAWRLGKLNDLRNKYLVKYLNDQVGGVLYPTLHQLRADDGGTVRGRFSCVRPNLQQVMGKDKHGGKDGFGGLYGWLREYGATDYLIKRLFIPAPGRRWLGTDARQLQFRIFVHYSESERLLQYYRDDPNVDFHKIVALFVQTAKPDITRTQVKTTSFTSLYGGGAGAVSRTLGIPEDLAHNIVETYHQEFPEVRRLSEKAEAAANARGYVKSLLGRRSRFLGSPKQGLHKALNCVILPSEADIAKMKMVRLYAERERLGLTLRMIGHDAFYGDLETDDLSAVNETLAIQEHPLRVPITWDSHLGANWAEAG